MKNPKDLLEFHRINVARQTLGGSLIRLVPIRGEQTLRGAFGDAGRLRWARLWS
jgi:hypothetical protein